MSTFLQVLRMAFWTSPLQRVLTCIAAAMTVVDIIRVFSVTVADSPRVFSFTWRGYYRPLPFEGMFYASVVCLLIGGVYWRIASAPRIVRLAPHGRARLLASVLGLALLVALLWNLQYAVYYLIWDIDLKYFPSMADHLRSMAGCTLGISVVVMSLFIASRSPLAALLVFIVLASPGVAAELYDVDPQRYLRTTPRLLTVLALVWIPFSLWYLNARRISPPRWLASGGQDVLATSLIGSVRPKSRREALERQLLGGTTIMQLGLMWFVVLGLLLGLQWLVVNAGEPYEPELVARVMRVSLCICPIVTTIVSFAAIRRSRALWLLATSSRVELLAGIDRILMRLNLAMMVVHASWLFVVWFAYSRQHGSLLEQLDAAQFNWLLLWVPGFLAINAQLARLPKWPMAILAAGVLVVVWRLSAEGPPGIVATMVLLVTAVVATCALRSLARRRWHDGDFPRAATSTASGT